MLSSPVPQPKPSARLTDRVGYKLAREAKARVARRALALPKPEPLKRTKARNDRIEAKVKQAVRAIVAARDGDCRLQGVPGFGVCGGESEWAHLEDKRRARTRGMDPTIRHTPQDSAQMCSVHHARYDAYEIAVEFLTPERADGRMTWSTHQTRYTETTR